MTPPQGLKPGSPGSKSWDQVPSPLIPIQDSAPSSVDTTDHDRATAKSLSELSRGCTDSICSKSQAWAGGLYLAQNDPKNAKEVYKNWAQNASDAGNVKQATLAKGLIALSEGRILDAKMYLTPIQDHPYAQALLNLIKENDKWVASIQTVHILLALCDDELALRRDPDPTLIRLKTFLGSVEDRLMKKEGPGLRSLIAVVAKDSPSFSDMPQALEKLADGAGGQILNTTSLSNEDDRAQTLLTLLDDSLLPNHRAGSSYLIARIFEKHPTYGRAAQRHLLELAGIKTNKGRMVLEMFDEGLSYFLVSYAALGIGRLAARGTWAYYTSRFSTEIPLFSRRWLVGQGITLGVSTGVYWLSDKLLLHAIGYDGKIWPHSVGEATRELGADLIVMGLANLLGSGARYLDKKWFPPLPASRWFFKAGRYAYRTPLKGLFYAGYGLAQGTGLYLNHRWQDNSGLIDRFRPGKPAALFRALSPSWNFLLLEGHQIQSSDRTLGQLLNHLMTLRDTPAHNQLRSRVTSLKQWIWKLDPAISVEQEEALLGVFWVAKEERGVLGASVQDSILKWTKEGRTDKVNDYFQKHEIPLTLTPLGEFEPVRGDSPPSE